MHGAEAGAAMGVNTWAAFAGSDEACVVDGDFAMLESELQGVLKALRAANIAFEIVPGISAAFASAAAAQVSLTDRRLSSRVLFTTFSRSENARLFAGVPIAPDTTVVVYMPGPDYDDVSHWLAESGIVAETPCLVISKASQREQVVRSTSVSLLGSLSSLPAPALLIVGRVASHSAVSAVDEDWLKQFGSENPGHLSIS